MRKTLFTLLGTATLALFVTGCAGPEQKLGRGVANTFEFLRAGEMRRSVEQATLFDSPEAGATTGVIRGFDRTLGRMGLGIAEIVTFPFPNYGKSYEPIHTRSYSVRPAYPESYAPNRLSGNTTLENDGNLGFAGGDVAPFIPGSRFRIMDN